MNSPRRIPIHLNCPHCRNPIELVAGSLEEEIQCPSCGSSFHLDPDRTESFSRDNLPQLGKFELIEPVGRGAFGTVYRARDIQLQRIVALKVPRSGQLATDEDEDRFVREARNAAQLQHSGIVPVYEVGRSATFPYIVSEFVEGNTLADALTAQRFGFRESAGLMGQVATALQHAHEQGVVHRDLKPSNIMLTPDGTPRVMDFGLAKRDAGEITMTIEGQVLGTPAYMSPEQASGQAHTVDGRSDVYSLGVILFELLTGELPFRGNQRMLLQQVMHNEPRSPRSLNDRIPRDLETICLKAMAKEPGRRYQTAQAMADDIARHLLGQPITARPIGRVERSWRLCRRNPSVASLSIGVVAVLLLGTIVSTHFAIQANSRAAEAIVEKTRADAKAAEACREAEKSAQAAQFVASMLDISVQCQRAGEIGISHMLSPKYGPLHTGDRVRVEFRAPRKAYFYVYWYGSEGRPKRLWPRILANQHETNLVLYPDDDFNHWAEIEGGSGNEMLLVGCADKPLGANQVSAFETLLPFGRIYPTISGLVVLPSAPYAGQRGNFGEPALSNNAPLATEFQEGLRLTFTSYRAAIFPHQ